MSEVSAPAVRWNIGHTLTLIGIGLPLAIAGATVIWTLGVQTGKAATDPTADLRAEMRGLQGTLARVQEQLGSLPDVLATARQHAIDLRRVEAMTEALRSGHADLRERVVILERGAPAARR